MFDVWIEPRIPARVGRPLGRGPRVEHGVARGELRVRPEVAADSQTHKDEHAEAEFLHTSKHGLATATVRHAAAARAPRAERIALV